MKSLDIILDKDILIKYAKQYANPLELSHCFVSPINNNCKDIGKILLFGGSNEILIFDLIKFNEQCLKDLVDIKFYNYEGMQHVFNHTISFPESLDALEKTINFLKNFKVIFLKT